MPYKNPEDKKAWRKLNHDKHYRYRRAWAIAKGKARTTQFVDASLEPWTRIRFPKLIDPDIADRKSERRARRLAQRRYPAMMLRTRLGGYLRAKNTDVFKEMIGCTIRQLILHLEAQFNSRMTWQNYGKWEIDHIVPCSYFRLPEEQDKCFHFSNLRPLWRLSNRKRYKNGVAVQSTLKL